MYLYGASGHALVISDILRAEGVEVKGVFDDNSGLTEFCGMSVDHHWRGQEPVIISIGNCAIRRKIAKRLACRFGTAIHPSAIISPSARIGEGTVVMPGAIINAHASIGRHCIINTKASVDHECRIGDFVHVAPGATMSGDVEVGEGTWIGVGACIKQGIKIGKNCMIGAGAVVVRDIPDGVTAFGNPCKTMSTNILPPPHERRGRALTVAFDGCEFVTVKFAA